MTYTLSLLALGNHDVLLNGVVTASLVRSVSGGQRHMDGGASGGCSSHFQARSVYRARALVQEPQEDSGVAWQC